MHIPKNVFSKKFDDGCIVLFSLYTGDFVELTGSAAAFWDQNYQKEHIEEADLNEGEMQIAKDLIEEGYVCSEKK